MTKAEAKRKAELAERQRQADHYRAAIDLSFKYDVSVTRGSCDLFDLTINGLCREDITELMELPGVREIIMRVDERLRAMEDE